MTESYELDGVTITATGGGFYTLTHPSLPADGQRERGKDAAEAAARKVAADAAEANSSQFSQPDLSKIVPPTPPAAPSDAEAKLAALQAEYAALAKTNASLEKTNEKLEKSNSDLTGKLEAADVETKTVKTDGGEVPAPTKVSAAVPRSFTGILDDKRKAELKKLGIEMSEIILDDNENIPPTGLFLGHNGRGYMIKPGEPVTVPNFLLNVLNDAVTSAPLKDESTLKVVGYRNRMRYSYRKLD